MAVEAKAYSNIQSSNGEIGQNPALTKMSSRKFKEYEVERYPENGIRVLVVGAGPGGLLSAMECWRKGFSVEIIDRSSGPINTGDTFLVQPSAMSIFRYWPQLWQEIEQGQYDADISYYRHDGEHIFGPAPPSFNDPENLIGRHGPHPGFMQGRVKFFHQLLRQVERCGISVEWGKKVIDYYEIECAGVGGVILESGERKEADVVIAADGLKTRSSKLISGSVVQQKDSGLATYRAAFPRSEMINANPVVHEQWQETPGTAPNWQFWLGAGLHFIGMVTDDIVVWGMTHKDDGTASESWTPDVDPADVTKYMEKEAPGWHPAPLALMSTTPKGCIVHWKLTWRDLLEQWTSPGGRVVQVGDSAHSFLPQSGNGASQAMEDAISLATCLQIGGRSGISMATKVHNKLRYQRISCAQKMTFVNSQSKHSTDWDAVRRSPISIRTRFPRWVWSHDPEAYAYQKYGEAFHHIVTGGKVELKNTNYPPGHKFRKWSIDEVRRDIQAGVSIEQQLDGDWS